MAMQIKPIAVVVVVVVVVVSAAPLVGGPNFIPTMGTRAFMCRV